MYVFVVEMKPPCWISCFSTTQRRHYDHKTFVNRLLRLRDLLEQTYGSQDMRCPWTSASPGMSRPLCTARGRSNVQKFGWLSKLRSLEGPYIIEYGTYYLGILTTTHLDLAATVNLDIGLGSRKVWLLSLRRVSSCKLLASANPIYIFPMISG